jgi:hypothetical protein
MKLVKNHKGKTIDIPTGFHIQTHKGIEMSRDGLLVNQTLRKMA